MLLRSIACVVLLLFGGVAAWAGEWNQFRGPQGNGVADADAQPPTHWGPQQNIRWKAALPRPGNSSPIVAGNRVFVTCAEDEKGQKRSLYCFDRATGERLWVRTVEYAKDSPTHETNPYCGSTPATDGQRVVVWHASAGLHCYDMDGKPLWSRDLGEFEHMWGYGTSPLLHRGRVIMQCTPGRQTFLAALSLDTGATLWQTEEPVAGDGDQNTEGKYMGSWATPIVVRVDGREQIIASMPTRVVGYAADTGALVWWCGGISHERGDLAYSSPLCDGQVCVATGGFTGPALGIRVAGAVGDVTATHRLWRIPQYAQSIGSGVLLDGVYYMANAGPGILECLDAGTGESLWKARGADANHWGSIVYAGGLLYATNQRGITLVFRPDRNQYTEVAANDLGEPSNSTPAVADDQIFVRTFQHLYCIGP